MSLGLLEAVVLVLVVGAVVLVLILTGKASRGRWEPDRWAREAGLRLTERNRPLVAGYIRRTRLLRTVGGLAGLAAPVIYGAITSGPLPRPFDFGLFDALTGYVLGAVVAEITFHRPKPQVPTASLVPRRLGDYLSPGLMVMLRVATALALALVPLYLLIPSEEAASQNISVSVLAPMIVLVFLGTEFLQRYIVARPKAVDVDLAEADDAVRTASVHALAGAGTAMEMLFVSVEISVIAFAGGVTGTARNLLGWVGLGCFLAALAVWMHASRPDRWRVRRARMEEAA